MVSSLGLQAAFAKPPREEEQDQCYHRLYSNAHLKQHPLQTIKEVYVHIQHQEEDEIAVHVGLEHRFNNQYWTATLYCHPPRNKSSDVECRDGKINGAYGVATVTWNDSKGHIFFHNKKGFGIWAGETFAFLTSEPKGDDIFKIDRKPCSEIFG